MFPELIGGVLSGNVIVIVRYGMVCRGIENGMSEVVV